MLPTMDNPDLGVFEELSKAEISVRTKGSRKSQSLLDLLDDNELHIQFNGCDTVHEYREELMSKYHHFKESLSQLAFSGSQNIEETILHLRTRINEVAMLLNPKDDDLVYAHVSLPRNPRFISDDYQANIVKKKY